MTRHLLDDDDISILKLEKKKTDRVIFLIDFYWIIMIVVRRFGMMARLKVLPKKTKSALVTTGTMARAVYHNPSVVGHWAEDIGESVRHGIKWVKNGFRLFYRNVAVSRSLVWKAAIGHQLTLRENKLLVRTTADVFKLVPFSLFIIIPFAELALPIFLRVFPNMLPSTFIEKTCDNAATARRIRAKRELAEFFSEVIEEQFREEFGRKILSTNSLPPIADVLGELGKLTSDQLRQLELENMDLIHLQRICRMMGLEPYGFKTHVVLKLRHYLSRIQKEDRQILWEGVDTLTFSELQDAVRARGMLVSDSAAHMRGQLEHWIELSSHRDVPISLLLWLRAAIPDQLPPVVSEEELFEGTAERQKERAEDVERRLEELEHEIVAIADPNEVQVPSSASLGEDEIKRLREQVAMLERIVDLQGRKSQLSEIEVNQLVDLRSQYLGNR